MQRKLLPIGLAGLACMSLFGAIINGTRHLKASADVAGYVAQPRQIRACVLVSDATQDPDSGSTGLYASNVTPYVFYALDQSNDLKPAGFEFVNPMAPSVINATIYQRWQNRSTAFGNSDRAFTNGTSENQSFQLNQPVTKNMAAYWEVNLDSVSTTDLQQFDIIYLPIHNGRNGKGTPVVYTPVQREKLRHYVDAGGTIWLEDTPGTPANAFSAETFFIGINTGNVPGNGVVSNVAGHHPLVDYPYQLSRTELYGLAFQTQMNNARFVDLATGGSNRPLSSAMVPIIQKNGVTTVWANDYGAGHVVISSAGIGSEINNTLLNPNGQGTAGSSVIGANDGAVSGNNLGSAPAPDYKFAYNLVSWLTSVPSAGVNSRRIGSTQENIGSALATKWAPLPILPSNPLESASVQNVGSGATIYKGMTFWVDGNNWFHAYDLTPQRSLNNNANPDDGIVDLIYGAPYDEVWNDKGGILPKPGNARASTPTIFSQFDANNGATYDVASVTMTDGSTYFYNAIPTNGNVLASSAQLLFSLKTETGDMLPGLTPGGNNNGTPISSAGLPYAQVFPKPAPAPVISDGIAFALVWGNPKGSANELGWRIAAVDVLASVRANQAVSVFDTGHKASEYAYLAPNASFNNGLSGFTNPTGSLTVGEVKSTESDAIDRVIYVPCAADDQANRPTSGSVRAVWFSTRNEPLNPDTTDASGRTYMPAGLRAHLPWYTSQNANTTIPLMPVVHIVRHAVSGGPVTGVNTYSYPADFDVSYKPSAGGATHDVRVIFHNGIAVNTFDEVKADYTLDWPGDTVGNVNSNTPSLADMETITGARRFGFFSPNPAQMLTESTGGIALDSNDNLILAETNLHDQASAGGGAAPPLEDRIFSVRDQFTAQTSGTTAGATALVRRSTALVRWMFSPLPARTFDQTFAGGIFNGYQIPSRLQYNGQTIYNFKAVGAPVVSNGTVYVVGGGFLAPQTATSNNRPDVTVMLALSETINASINIGVLNDANANITLLQPSLLHPQNPVTLSPADYTLEKVLDPTTNKYVGIVTFNNFQASTTDGDSFNTMLPIWVRTGAGNGAASVSAITNTKSQFGPLDNLIYYVAWPNHNPANTKSINPTSGPTVAGSVLYFSGLKPDGTTTVASIDLTQAQQVTANPSPNLGFVSLPSNPIVQSVDPANGGAGLQVAYPSVNPPVGTTNVVVAANAQALTGLDNGLILIADNHRLLEVDANGNAVWTMESTVSQSPVGSNVAGANGLGFQTIGLSNPTIAHQSGLNTFVIADAGNNRIVGTNRGGTVNFELHGFKDDMHFLPAGDPLALNQPTDVETWTDRYTNYSLTNRDTGVTYTFANTCFVTHYLIADGGNYRVVDIADITDANGNPVTLAGSDGSSVLAAKVLVFSSRSLAQQNLRYRYRTVVQNLASGRNTVLTAVTNVRPGQTDTNLVDSTNAESPGGAILELQYFTGLDPNGKPAVAGEIITKITSFVAYNPDGTTRRQTISNPTWCKGYYNMDLTNPTAISARIYVADANGCYILKPITTTVNSVTVADYVADWMLTSDDYYYMTGRRLLAISIQKENLSDLSSRNLFEPRLLITNAYSGVDALGTGFGLISQEPTTGEVFEIKTSAYYTNGAKGVLGYRYAPYQRYQGVGTNNPGSGIINDPITRMIPQETVVRNQAGTFVGIKRRIGTVGSGQTTYTLEAPKFAEKPF